MENEKIRRSPTSIIIDTIPQSERGRVINSGFAYEIMLVPPLQQNIIQLGIKPLFLIRDSQTKQDLYKFQTSTFFEFNNPSKSEEFYQLVYYLINVAIDEFNTFLKDKKSELTHFQEFPKDSYEKTLPRIIEAYNFNSVN